MLHKDPADVDIGERSMAKMVNFGLAYGMSDFGLAPRANIPRQEAQEFINSYFAAYSGISYYMMAIKEQAKNQGFVETLLGPAPADPGAAGANPALRGAGERMAINMPIQGTAADIQKIAMIRVGRAGRGRGLAGAAAADRPRRAAVRGAARRGRAAGRAVVRETMEGALPLSVPLVVDVKVGDNWESMTPLTREDAIAAEADELPLEAPIAPLAGCRAVRTPSRSSRPRRRPAREVETVARDLRGPWSAPRSSTPRRVGSDAAGRPTPEAVRREGVAGRRIEAVGRRGKQLVVELSGRRVPDDPPQDDRPALRRAPGRARTIRTSGSCSSSRTAAEIRFRDIRKFGRIGL